ncbi:hypothetical protein BBM24_10795 [Vibrio parahaemolyticus]|uniref:hypothetical protein n=1 Tax=Vibrio TaxID=662 RepID=UPI0005F03957|nr:MULTISPECIES: hypothetical protein [Vibrio]EGR0746697.1 hypothetical protein [Vibrio parahaemolyticus]EGR0749186.1 hypothetical protein [Vibrio parahaemolyticus]EGR1179085.1 hypothetical protein [Vibrio parahaemolyticus]EHO8533841.1 hypothetical protein [Vibrio parahaemolyticus]EIF2842540.1 hypothetical protein [Vibrio parahaemolyticus]
MFDEFGTQKDLFPIQAHLDAMGIQRMSLRYLFAEGVLSFDPDKVKHLSLTQVLELKVLKPLILVDARIEEIRSIVELIGLVNVDTEGQHYFDWTNLSWEEVVKKDEPYKVCHHFIDNCEDTEELQELKDAIELRLRESL